MGRKQITYAHKRSRNRNHGTQESKSSPLDDISDPEQYLTHPEMTRRILKRSRRSGSGSTSLDVSENHVQGTQVHSYKKLRTSPPEEDQQGKSFIFPFNDNCSNLHTPHPTQLTEDQVFKLESSRGLPLSPDHEFSPVPLAPPQRGFSPVPYLIPTRITHKTTKRGKDSLFRQTSSKSLKENMSTRSSRPALKSAPRSTISTAGNSSHRTRSRSKARDSRLPLASPFTSQPSSPNTHSLHTRLINKPIKINKIDNLIITTTTANSKRTLADTHYNPNLPQAQSTANSPARPAHEAECVKARRPSAPSATSYRPDVASWFVSPSNHDDIAKTESVLNVSGCGRRGLGVDFNRPPSQLSFTSAYDEDFFGDAQGFSTPFGLKSQKKAQTHEYADPMESSSSEDEDEEQYLSHYVSYISRPRYDVDPNNQVKLDKTTCTLEMYPEREHSTWVTDSLISIPTALRAYSRPMFPDERDNVLMLDDDDEDGSTLGLGPGLGFDLDPCFEDVLLKYDGAENMGRVEWAEDKEETLKELFASLELAYGGTSTSFHCLNLPIDAHIRTRSTSGAY
jgi:hypothetical protein